jgi:hypothetical protein
MPSFLTPFFVFFYVLVLREEKRAANVIADDVKGVDCLVLESRSVTANLHSKYESARLLAAAFQ